MRPYNKTEYTKIVIPFNFLFTNEIILILKGNGKVKELKKLYETTGRQTNSKET